ncbi:molybdopterin molybdotransferase MoeA [Albimonas sp. CAU 1670]|uniref:molybdopterin molybdotransferase MoeA n=1 Tax=Albimonas sp. CAU 1670 TaxID=3032599 RepID=UPI0023D9969F|nr:gephyrin-like molybdotransferase Glp [Albimonas sp. CAU 1670]MDF2234225.1 molybdopterin molybdotransferase MoeA [Albimonas sp. CAU 1670]
MIPTAEALSRILTLISPVRETETVPLLEAAGRVLAAPAAARRTQPPFAASAMDGYAIRGAELRPGAEFEVIGESQAGLRFAGEVGPGQAVRIFTGAPVPEGADHVLIQEDAEREGARIRARENLDAGANIRPAGGDFSEGETLSAPRRLSPRDVALLAAMNIPEVEVLRRPVVAILATGDELVEPGETPGPDQIVSSNSYGLHALLAARGAAPRLAPIARDTMESLAEAFAAVADADMVVTLGGASVGDHDLVGRAAAEAGLELDFWKVNMRPGKPLMAGRLPGAAGPRPLLGLPGNPVSAMVCAQLFLLPAVDALSGLPATPAPRLPARLVEPVGANGPREHFARARLEPGPQGLGVRVLGRQDSSLLSVLAEADALAVLPPGSPALEAGATVEVIVF